MGWVIRTRGRFSTACRKQMRMKKSNARRVLVIAVPLGLALVMALLQGWGGDESHQAWTWTQSGVGRRLLSAGGSCPDLESWQKNGGVAAYLVGVLYMFLGIAIVCDDFFVASLEAICEKLHLSEDVAGATFMAAGSSAPELFSSMMSLVSPNSGNEMGIGAIVGSAVFNILVIVGATAVCAGKTLDIDWRPLLRDCSFYAGSIFSSLCIFYDEKVYWWEGLISVICYLFYVLFMRYNEAAMSKLDLWEQSWFPEAYAKRQANKEPEQSANLMPEQEPHRAEEPVRRLSSLHDDAHLGKYHKRAIGAERRLSNASSRAESGLEDEEGFRGDARRDPHHDPQQPEGRQESGGVHRAHNDGLETIHAVDMSGTALPGSLGAAPAGPEAKQQFLAPPRADVEMGGAERKAAESKAAGAAPGAEVKEEGEEDEGSPFKAPSKAADYPLWLISLPWYFAFTYTVPPCGDEKWEKYYLASFAMSIAWIMGISYFMVDWTAMIGCCLDVPDVVMGVTVLAAGTSIPDALSSIVVARQGMGDMAVANAVGSNVFDIWLGLGLPWLVYLPFVGGDLDVSVGQLTPNILILLGVLILYFGSISFHGFKLTVGVGKVFLVLYMFYVAYMVGLVWLMDIYNLDGDSDSSYPPPPVARA